MDNSYFGEPSLGNGRSGSSRKGKKSNSEKPKQPQRGLGVAQLEKIRLHTQMGCSYLPSIPTPYNANLNQEDMSVETTYSSVPSSSSSSFSYSSSLPSFDIQPNIMMGFGEMETTDFTYGDSQFSSTARWNRSSGILETQHSMQPRETRYLLSPNVEVDIVEKKGRKDRSGLMGSSSQNSDSRDAQDIDLELKLSL